MPVNVVDNAMRQALGQGVLPISETYDVYRVTGSSTGQVVSSANKVISNFKARIVHSVPKALMENTEAYEMFYSGMCNPKRLRIGDVLVRTGPQLIDNDPRCFTLACVQPMFAPVFARTEIAGAITRMNSKSTSSEPLLGDGGYVGTSKEQEWVMALNSGIFSFEPPSGAVSATIPFGVQQHPRPGDKQAITIPTGTPRGRYFVYLPALNGEYLQPGDIVSDAVGNRYILEVITLYDVGIKGYQCIAQSVFI